MGSVPLVALRKNRPRGCWPQVRCANSSTRSQRGRCSGVGRPLRIEEPRVASMFSPSTSTYVERTPSFCIPPAYGSGGNRRGSGAVEQVDAYAWTGGGWNGDGADGARGGGGGRPGRGG